VGCAAMFFKDVTGNQACVVCQQDLQSASSATSQSACECNQGYHQEGKSTCVACETGKFSDTLDAAVCLGCGFGKYTNTVAQSVCASCWDNSGHDPVDQTIASVRRETICRYYACVVVYLTLSLSGTLHVRCRAGVHKQPQREARKSCAHRRKHSRWGAALSAEAV